MLWEIILERGGTQMARWRKHIARWITTATNTQSEYVMLIAFPQQQWLHERASVLGYTLSCCPVLTRNTSPHVFCRPWQTNFAAPTPHSFAFRGNFFLHSSNIGQYKEGL